MAPCVVDPDPHRARGLTVLLVGAAHPGDRPEMSAPSAARTPDAISSAARRDTTLAAVTPRSRRFTEVE